MLQVRNDDGRRWSADRDLSVIFPNALRASLAELQSVVDDLGYLSSAQHDVVRRLGVGRDDMVAAMRFFANLISGVQSRAMTNKDAELAVRSYCGSENRAFAALGVVFLKQMSLMFVRTYGSTLIKGEVDPNARTLNALVECLEEASKPTTIWSQIRWKIATLWAILISPVIVTGPFWRTRLQDPVD